MDCRVTITRASIAGSLATGTLPPRCTCGGVLAPDAVLFGQPLDPVVFDGATRAAASCRTMLVIGTSLAVYPANTFPSIARYNGAKVFLFNNEATMLDEEMEGIVTGDALATVPLLLDLVKERIEKRK